MKLTKNEKEYLLNVLKNELNEIDEWSEISLTKEELKILIKRMEETK